MRLYAFFYLLIIILFLSANAYTNAADIKDGLIIYFSFDEIDGDTVPNNSGLEIDGTLEAEAEQVPGYLNNGLALNPNSGEAEPGQDFVRVANNPEVNVGEQFTIAVWAKGTNFGDYRTLMSNTDSSGYALTVENGAPSSWIHVNGAYLQAAGKTALQPEKWYHLALTYDGNDAIIYLDGEIDGKGTSQGNITLSNSDFFIGAEPSGQGLDTSYPAWHGTIDEFYFYNRALTKVEVNSLISAGQAVKATGKLPHFWGYIRNFW